MAAMNKCLAASNKSAREPKATKKREIGNLGLLMALEKVDEMADDPREDPEVVVNTFLQHKNLEQMQDYLACGRRFTKFDVRQLTEDWITAVRNWLAHKDHTNERMMNDLAAELRLRGLEPPYLAVERELANCSAQTKESEQKKVLRAFAREIDEFMRENQSPLH